MTDVMRRAVLPHLNGVRPVGGGYTAQCPVHDDSTPSLSINAGRDQPVVMFCQGCGAQAPEIAEAAGIDWPAISKRRDTNQLRDADDTWIVCGWSKDKPYNRKHRKVAEYIYRDQNGKVVFGVARCALKGTDDCKGFRQWRPDPDNPGRRKWSRSLPDGTKVGEGLIYRLPDILNSDALRNVWIVEGEKDADRLWSLGVPATCNPQGAGAWTDVHAEWLQGRDVIIVADRDEPGRKHAIHVSGTLMEIADSIEILQAVHGKDASDHLDAGGTLASFKSVAEPKKLTGFGVTA